MAFLVAGTLRVAAHIADAQDSLARKVEGRWGPTCLLPSLPGPSLPSLALPSQGTYSLRAPRAALTICSPEVPDSTIAILEATLRALGFHSCQRREASAQVGRGKVPQQAGCW